MENSSTSTMNKLKPDPAKWVDLYGNYLFRYAFFRVNNKSTAEDIVQETFLSALKAIDNFKFKSTEKTWLTGILKFKIIDYYRKKAKESLKKKISEQLNKADSCDEE